MSSFDTLISASDDREVVSLQLVLTDSQGTEIASEVADYTSVAQDHQFTHTWEPPFVIQSETFTLTITATDTSNNPTTEILLVDVQYQQPSTVLPDPISYWSFEPEFVDGQNLYDTMGRNHGVGDAGANLAAAGKAGNGLQVNNQLITIPHSETLAIRGDQMTVQVWAKASTLNGLVRILNKPMPTATDSPYAIYRLGLSSNNYPYVLSGTSDGHGNALSSAGVDPDI